MVGHVLRDPDVEVLMPLRNSNIQYFAEKFASAAAVATAAVATVAAAAAVAAVAAAVAVAAVAEKQI